MLLTFLMFFEVCGAAAVALLAPSQMQLRVFTGFGCTSSSSFLSRGTGEGLGIIQADPCSVDECSCLEAQLHVNTSLTSMVLDTSNEV